MTVRTARLAAGNSGAAAAQLTMYTCPAGRTAIIKDLRFAKNLTSGPEYLFVTLRTGAVTVGLFNLVVGDGQTVVAFAQPWVVLEPGDFIRIFSNTAGAWGYWLSGTELEGVAP